MCGIFGALTTKGLKNSRMEKISELFSRRGPDDEGILNIELKSGKLQLLHRRLSIIDLSNKGHQPMSYNGGEIWITYNGEIYNYRELRNELRRKGHKFESETDTEVVLASYKEWGPDCVKYFNGDWAFCIYDKRNDKLFLSRDRLGVKPLYYCRDNENFAFSSKIKALFLLPCLKKEWNRNLVGLFVLFGISDFSSQTMFKNIYQLMPAHNMILDLPSAKMTVYKYWNVSFNKDRGRYSLGEERKHKANIRNILEDAVKLRLRADVNVGTCLSGGIDSSIVAVLINKFRKEKVKEADSVGNVQKTFTASYKGEKIDERKYVKVLAQYIKADSKFVFPSYVDLNRDLEMIGAVYDELVFSTSAYSQYRVMDLASNYVKVVLDGQGADELFGGYWSSFKKNAYRGMLPYFKKFFLRTFYYDKIKILRRIFGDFNLDTAEDIFVEKMAFGLNKQLFLDETKFNLPQLLRYEDRNSMNFSVEARVPFTDYRLVEYVLGMPSCYKIHKGWTKYILRLAFEDMLPSKIVWRRDKIGFETPEKKWLLQTEKFVSFLERYNLKQKYNGDHFYWRLFNFYFIDGFNKEKVNAGLS